MTPGGGETASANQMSRSMMDWFGQDSCQSSFPNLNELCVEWGDGSVFPDYILNNTIKYILLNVHITM